VRAQRLEGLVAKRLDSRYEPGARSGAWQKMRVNRGQDFVIGGYTPGPHAFDALIFGYYQDGNLIYAGRTRSGFTPAVRAQVHRRFRGLEIPRARSRICRRREAGGGARDLRPRR
jgi:bifunctional non-homologous end joining protein LigD